VHVRIDELTDIAAHHEVAALLNHVWHAPVMDASTLHALSHVGNYIAGAYDGELVGAAVGFFAVDGHLHSHLTAVAPECQGRGIGYALKRHQRDWALARQRTTISWTFDPLLPRNAYFNLHKVGATVTEYLPDFYGPMDDEVNAGDATDRLFVVWHLNEPVPAAPDPAGATAVLAKDGNEPVGGALQGRHVSVATPHDIERLRVADPALAVRWRMEVRDALTGAMEAGYRITGITRDGQYQLEAP